MTGLLCLLSSSIACAKVSSLPTLLGFVLFLLSCRGAACNAQGVAGPAELSAEGLGRRGWQEQEVPTHGAALQGLLWPAGKEGPAIVWQQQVARWREQMRWDGTVSLAVRAYAAGHHFVPSTVAVCRARYDVFLHKLWCPEAAPGLCGGVRT
jgi:hypothetical protein